MPISVSPRTKIYRTGEPLPVRDPWIEKIAYLMDAAIPLGRWSIGLDPLIGLVPVVGDVLSAMISMFIVARAVQNGVPRIAVARMVTNIAVDTLIGSIPVAGDVFDFAYRANLKNLRIYEQSLESGHTATARHWGFFAALFLAVAAVVAGVLYGLYRLAYFFHI